MLKGPRALNEFAAEVRRGGLVATPGALERFAPEQLKTALHRHMALDWKDMDKEDQAANLCAAMEGGARVLGPSVAVSPLSKTPTCGSSPRQTGA